MAVPTPLCSTSEVPERSVAVSYEYSLQLPALLESLNVSVVLSTYQAGRIVSLGVNQGSLNVGFSRFDRAMGLCRTPKGISVGTRDSIWNLLASHEIAPQIKPEDTHDIAFLARHCHHTGPLMGHDLSWCNNQLWLVNTLFNGLVTIEPDWSFVPRWKPSFISKWEPGDRCHLNGLAVTEDGKSPAYVTTLGETDTKQGWREDKASGGCVIDVRSGEVIARGLSMPHSPRLHQGQLYVLNSGCGTLVRIDPSSGHQECVVALPGFTRGLDCFGEYAFVGLSQIRESSVFGGLPVQSSDEQLCSGCAVVNLKKNSIEGLFWFHSGVEEVFSTLVLPGWTNPALIGPDTSTDANQCIWLVPKFRDQVAQKHAETPA